MVTNLKIAVVLILSSIMIFMPVKVNAQSLTTSRIDAVLVHDVSGSMFDSDPNEISLDVMKMFVDLCDYGFARVGMVTFSDEIVGTKALTEINNESDKATVKNYINSMKFTRQNTDIGLALKTAVDILNQGGDVGNSRFIVLLSDGKTYLSENDQRSIQDSRNDVLNVISEAQFEGYPIYTIGLNFDGGVDRDELSKIASDTNGVYYETDTSINLPAILKDIFARHGGVKNENLAQYMADGTLETIEIEIPDSTVMSANIIITAPQGIRQANIFNPNGQQIPIPSDRIIYSSGSAYYLYKILTPEKGTWILQIQGVDEDSITIDLIMSRDFTLELETEIDNNSKKINITSFLLDQNNQNINDYEIYNTSEVTVFITDENTGVVEEFDMNFSNNEFYFEYDFADNRKYTIRSQLTNGHLHFYSDFVEIDTVVPVLPTQSSTPTPTPTPTPTTSAPTPTSEIVQDSEEDIKPIRLYVIAGIAIAVLLALIVALLFVIRKISKQPTFRYGKLSISLSGVELSIPPFVWDFEQMSFKKRWQPFIEIMERVCEKGGGNVENVMDRDIAAAIKFRMDKSGGLCMVGADSSLNVTNADSIGKNEYLLYDNAPATLYLDNGGRIVLRFIED